jgi:hypothetical protein
MSKKKRRIPPRDSWITLAPGATLRVDAELQAKWQKHKKDFREVRGNFLAAFFDIEYQLDLLLCEILFPGLDDPEAKPTDRIPLTIERGKVLRGFFDEMILKGGSLPNVSFALKIDLLKKAIPCVPVLEEVLVRGLVNKLDEVRKIRNRFAHYPIAFTPVGDVQKSDLAASLECKDKSIPLDQDFFDKHSLLFGGALNGVEETLKTLKQNIKKRSSR